MRVAPFRSAELRLAELRLAPMRVAPTESGSAEVDPLRVAPRKGKLLERASITRKPAVRLELIKLVMPVPLRSTFLKWDFFRESFNVEGTCSFPHIH